MRDRPGLLRYFGLLLAVMFALPIQYAAAQRIGSGGSVQGGVGPGGAGPSLGTRPMGPQPGFQSPGFRGPGFRPTILGPMLVPAMLPPPAAGAPILIDTPRRRPPRQTRASRAVPPPMVADEVLVETRAALSAPQIEALARRFRLTLLSSDTLPFLNTAIYRMRVPRGTAVTQVLRRLRGDGAVRFAQANFLFRLSEEAAPAPPAAPAKPAEAPFGLEAQYALGLMQVPEAQTVADGQNVRVAVIDSGVDADHPELRGAVAATFDARPDTAIDAEHGTAVAALIAAHARLRGVAPGATLLSARAFGAGAGATGTTLAILRALDWAGGEKARIVNLSFAGPQDAALARALATVSDKGLVLIAATGNAGAASPPLYPAADPHVIAVAATDAADHLFAASVRGAHVALAAPGVDVFTAVPGGKYRALSGTSFAAAEVSGVAALMLQWRPELTPARLRAVLAASAQDLGPKGRDDQFGAGRVNAAAALRALGGAVAQSREAPSGSSSRQ